MQWAAVGKTTVTSALQSYKWCHTYVDGVWYLSNTGGNWKEWNNYRLDPLMMRTFCGKTKKLEFAVAAVMAGHEVVIPCHGDEKDVAAGRVRRMRASLKLLDYNISRDLSNGAGTISRRCSACRDSAFIDAGDDGPRCRGHFDRRFNGDGKPGICLVRPITSRRSKTTAARMLEATIPGLLGGARAACWADFHGPPIRVRLPTRLRASPWSSFSWETECGQIYSIRPRRSMWPRMSSRLSAAQCSIRFCCEDSSLNGVTGWTRRG